MTKLLLNYHLRIIPESGFRFPRTTQAQGIFRRIKIHYSYTVKDAADALGTHKNTVRLWTKQGLPITDEQRVDARMKKATSKIHSKFP
jgi:hypothetical protein